MRPDFRLSLSVLQEDAAVLLALKSQGFDPADYVDADDLGRLLGDDFTIELHAVKPRMDPPPDTPHIADVVLRARRR